MASPMMRKSERTLALLAPPMLALLGCAYDYDRFSEPPGDPGTNTSGGSESLGGSSTTDVTQGGFSSTDPELGSTMGGSESQGGNRSTDVSPADATGGSDSSRGSGTTQIAQGGTSQVAQGGTTQATQGGTTSHQTTSVQSATGGSSNAGTGQGGSTSNPDTGGRVSTGGSSAAGCTQDGDCGSKSEATCVDSLCVCSGTTCDPGQICHKHNNSQECRSP